MKIYIFPALLAVALGKGKKCFAPMICNNVPTWARISMSGEDGTCGNQMKQLEGKADNLDRSIDEMFERLEHFKTLKSTTMPVTVDNIKETTAKSVEPNDNAMLTMQAADTTTISEPATTRGIETTSEGSTNGLTTSVATTVDAGLCPVHYGGKCFYVEMQDVTLGEARELCSQNQSIPANIYSEKHMEDVMNEIRSKMRGRSIGVWTGMKVHLTTGAVSLRDGSPAPYVKWRSGGFPDKNESGLYIVVNKDRSLFGQEMGNDPPKYRKSGVICEIQVANN